MKIDSGPASPLPQTSSPNGEAAAAAHALAYESAELPAPALADHVRLDRRFVTAGLMLVMVLASMEMTITSTAMPTIIGELHGLEHYSWVASVYLLACTVSMPLYGRLADALGRKRVVLAAIVLFLVGSGLAARAHTMGQLITWRALQGLGAGGVMPVVLTILGDIFTLEERAKIQGAFSAVWGTASLAGPWLGANLVTHFGWRSVFYVNFPLGLPALLVLIWKYHDREKPHSTDLDLPGALTLALACTGVLALVSRVGPGGWPTPVAVALAIGSLVAIVYLVIHERRAANPIMPPNLLVHRMILPSLVGSLLLGVGFLSLDTYVPLYVQGGQGGDANAAARVVTPVMLTWAISGVFAAPLVVRWGFRRTALLGSCLIVVGFSGLLQCARHETSHWILTAVLAITGLGFGPASMSYLLAAQDSVQWQQRGIVTSSVQFYRTIGGAVGIGLFGALFNLLIAPDLASLRDRGITPAALLDPHERAKLPPDVLHAAGHTIAGGLLWVFGGMLLCAILQVLITLWMPAAKCEHPVRRSEALEAMAG
jgi:MFS family permease